MFALFFSLYYSMFSGQWVNVNFTNLFWGSGGARDQLISVLNGIGKFITSIFTETTTYDTLGTDLISSANILMIVSFVLTLITSIGIVVMAVKGVKKAFGIFFMGIR